jgi:hypothetical protein
MKNTAMHKCYYLVQPTNTRKKLNIEFFCKFGRVKVTAPQLTMQGRFFVQGGGGYSYPVVSESSEAQHHSVEAVSPSVEEKMLSVSDPGALLMSTKSHPSLLNQSTVPPPRNCVLRDHPERSIALRTDSPAKAPLLRGTGTQ